MTVEQIEQHKKNLGTQAYIVAMLMLVENPKIDVHRQILDKMIKDVAEEIRLAWLEDEKQRIENANRIY